MTEKREQRVNVVLKALTLAAVAVGVCMLGVLVWITFLSSSTYNPITFETVRVVEVLDDGAVRIPQVMGYEAPSINASDQAVPLLVNRCSSATESITATATTDFVVDATGERFRFSGGTDVAVTPGCVQSRFSLEMPREMLALVDNQDGARESDAVSFHMEGFLDIEGGGTATWVSESYLVIDDDPIIPAGD